MKSMLLREEPMSSPMPNAFPNRDAKIRPGAIRKMDRSRNTEEETSTK